MQVTGVVIVKMDGAALRSKEGATLNFGGKERVPVYADGRLIGFAEKPMGATVSATIAHTSDTDVTALIDAENVTVVFKCDSGVSYIIAEAFLTTPPELTGGEGDMTVEWTGQPAIQS